VGKNGKMFELSMEAVKGMERLDVVQIKADVDAALTELCKGDAGPDVATYELLHAIRADATSYAAMLSHAEQIATWELERAQEIVNDFKQTGCSDEVSIGGRLNDMIINTSVARKRLTDRCMRVVNCFPR